MKRALFKIRSMEETDCQLAAACARRAAMTLAEWVGEAIREKAQREREPFEGEIIGADENPGPGGAPGSGRSPSLTITDPAQVTPRAVIEAVEAWKALREMRGMKVSPRSRVMIGATRLMDALVQRLLLLPPPAARASDAPEPSHSSPADDRHSEPPRFADG
jgi:hypothetical protein